MVIEDEAKMAKALKKGLNQAGYDVEGASTGEDAFFLISTNKYDLILLDWMLPGRSGIEILKAMRESQNETPVLILTAKDEVEDKVEGFDAGADDYLVKPFAFPELLARIRALSKRRADPQADSNTYVMGDLKVNLIDRNITRDGKEIDLTKIEFNLLVYFLKNKGVIVSRKMLCEDVWKVHARTIHMDNVIDVTITRLRRKIDGPHKKKLIKTVRGVGFTLNAGSSK